MNNEEARDSYRIVCIFGDKAQDEMMHKMDVFESFKALAITHVFEITLNKPEPISKLTDSLRRAMAEKYRVVAIFSPNIKEGSWVDPTVKVISNGQQFCRLEHMLSHHDYVGGNSLTYEPISYQQLLSPDNTRRTSQQVVVGRNM